MNKFILLASLALLLIFGWVYFAFNIDEIKEVTSDEPKGNDVVEPSVYTDPEGAFTIVLPSLSTISTEGYKVDESYENQQSPELIIDGIKFTIPPSMASGTNLSADTYISIENLPDAEICTADLFFDGARTAALIDDGGVVYSVATSSNAGAGNRYEETVYALEGPQLCTGVRYLVHYTVLENYEQGTVAEFDQDVLLREFEAIRRSLVLKR